LEYLYKAVANYQTVALEELLQWYQQARDQELHSALEKVEYTKTDIQDDVTIFYDRGVTYCERYYSHYNPFTQSIPIAIEKNISLQLTNGDTMSGIIDRLDIHGRDMIITDYKTSKQLPTDGRDVPRDQITLYALAVEQDYGSKLDRIIAKVIYLHLQQEYTREVTKEDLAMTKKKYQDIIDDIRQKKDKW